MCGVSTFLLLPYSSFQGFQVYENFFVILQNLTASPFTSLLPLQNNLFTLASLFCKMRKKRIKI